MVAVGGDGTLNEVISGIQTLKTPPVVGYLPQGSTNDFAASLEIPSDPVQAAEAIVRGQRRQLDIGRFGDAYFRICSLLRMPSPGHPTPPLRM